MEVLYDASWKQAKKPVDKDQPPLALERGIVCRAGALSPSWRPTPSPVFSLRSFLVGVANGLIILALAGLLFTFSPLIRSELGFRFQGTNQKGPAVARAHFGDLLESLSLISQPELVAPDPQFSIVIPKIQARAKIIANVDPNDPAVYNQALRKGVAHAAGSSFPGREETIWLFAHSTDRPWHLPRYNAVFYLLRKLEPGDAVTVFFNGHRFNYQVFAKKIVEPDDISFLAGQGQERLVLQTCWPPGTTLKRLIVLAKPSPIFPS